MIYVLDGLVARPGCLGRVNRQVRDVYQPLARQFGMRLAHTWMAPAVELRDRPTELLVVWELADVPAYWRMRVGAAGDERVLRFWRDLEPLLAGRTRRVMCEPDDPEILR